MYECKNPFQYVKEHEKDYLIFKGNRWFIKSVYGGMLEIEKKEFERLEERGMEVR